MITRLSCDIILITGKDWDDIIPEAERKKIEEEELKQQMEELNLPPRARKQVNEVSCRGFAGPSFCLKC